MHLNVAHTRRGIDFVHDRSRMHRSRHGGMHTCARRRYVVGGRGVVAESVSRTRVGLGWPTSCIGASGTRTQCIHVIHTINPASRSRTPAGCIVWCVTRAASAAPLYVSNVKDPDAGPPYRHFGVHCERVARALDAPLATLLRVVQLRANAGGRYDVPGVGVRNPEGASPPRPLPGSCVPHGGNLRARNI